MKNTIKQTKQSITNLTLALLLLLATVSELTTFTLSPISVSAVELTDKNPVSYVIHDASDSGNGPFSVSEVNVKTQSDGTKYGSISLKYPSGTLDIQMPATSWKRKDSLNGGYTSISFMETNATAENVRTFLSGITFTKKTPEAVVYGKFSVTLNKTSISNFVDSQGVNHYYEKIDKTSSINWYEAYNEAKTKTYNGMKGYLATITSAEEQDYIYYSVAKTTGWLGGTRARKTAGGEKIADEDTASVPTSPYDTRNNKWYWASGPEGKNHKNDDGNVFFSAATFATYSNQTDANPKVAGELFDFFQRKNQPMYRTSGTGTIYATPKNPNDPNDPERTLITMEQVATGKAEPNGTTSEGYLQFAYSDIAPWNDFAYNNTNIKTYYVEYGGYDKLAEDELMAENAMVKSVSFSPGESDFSNTDDFALLGNEGDGLPENTRFILRKQLDHSGAIENAGLPDRELQGTLDGVTFEAYHVESRFYQLRKKTVADVINGDMSNLSPELRSHSTSERMTVEMATKQISYEYSQGKLTLGNLAKTFLPTGSTITQDGHSAKEVGTTFADLPTKYQGKNAVYLIVEKKIDTMNSENALVNNNVFKYEQPLVAALPAFTEDGVPMDIVYLYPKDYTSQIKKEVITRPNNPSTDYAFGEVITFKITVPVPEDINAQVWDGENYISKYTKLEIKDTPELTENGADHITLDEITSVTAEGAELSGITATVDHSGITSALITIPNTSFAQLEGKTSIEVILTGHIPYTLDNGQFYLNNADYLVDIALSDSDFQAHDDTKNMVIGTGQFTIEKIDGDSKMPLENVPFLVKRKNEQDEVIYLKFVGTGSEKHPTWVTSEEDAEIFRTDENGEIHIIGVELDNDYEIKELQAPDGYLLGEMPNAFAVTNIDHTEVVENFHKGFLPSTGGMGTLIFMIIGLSGMALIFLIYKHKNEENEHNFEID